MLLLGAVWRAAMTCFDYSVQCFWLPCEGCVVFSIYIGERMYFLIPFLKVDGEHKWVPPRLCESTQLALGIKKMIDILCLIPPSITLCFLVPQGSKGTSIHLL